METKQPEAKVPSSLSAPPQRAIQSQNSVLRMKDTIQAMVVITTLRPRAFGPDGGRGIGEAIEAINGIAPGPATVEVLGERVLAGQAVARFLEGKAQMQVGVGYEAARVGLVTTEAGRRDPARAEADDLIVSRGGFLLIACDLQSAGVGPETAGALGRGLHGTRGGAQRCRVVSGFKRREREICEEPMLRIKRWGQFRSRSRSGSTRRMRTSSRSDISRGDTR